ncbi:ABR215Cp [Eremothecium gossypii ATCC 10895]|uniref:Altered inheritance of mitochondria protein 11 n=1 Tax=Eremothecium gossypii (strain ATCC 10895 / CBS 109.51 / FGSC 9923 / NRRL Y-1056) TaxID=284811 RepID=AIM11_EREGS|nr:ABR215Cp [Eremothecium gossypii ATCC 10895]Q75D07.2 RecName: Full=Altered inheritance of mitochondria protein 11 [Eremothecium gossypii ATCC 10895]AAS50988.2 ABR215Cp [Eremothecium gossypii ATCC 10895]
MSLAIIPFITIGWLRCTRKSRDTMSSSPEPQAPMHVTQRQISVFSDEFRQRRRQQMLRFFGATAFTLLSARLAFRGTINRKYVPNMFQLNHRVPLASSQGEALHAFAYGSGLATGGFAMLILGTCWLADVSTVPEFSLRIKALLGESDTQSGRLESAHQDKETRELAAMLDSLLQEKKD